MVGLSLPPVVCRSARVFIYVICVCLRTVVSNTNCVVFLFSFSSCCCRFIWIVHICGFWCLMSLSTIFQLYRAWRSALLVKETVLPVENHRLVASHWQTLLHNDMLSAPRYIRTHNFSGDWSDYADSGKSNYHTITTKTVPNKMCMDAKIKYEQKQY
jgi:hypothetical protein